MKAIHWTRSIGWLALLCGLLSAPRLANSQESAVESSMLARLEALERQYESLAHAPAPVLDAPHSFGTEVVHVCPAEPPCLVCPGWEVSAETLYWKPRQRGLDFALTEDGSATIFGNGQVHDLDYDRNAAARATIGYRTKTDWALRFGYTSFETDGLAFAERPPGTAQLFPTRSQPDGFQEANGARASSTFELQLFDIVADRPIFTNRFTQVSVFGGVRWLDFEQGFRTHLNGRDFTNGQIIQDTSVDGVGLRLGTAGRWQFAGGFAAVGSLAGGLTHGRYRTRFYEDNLDGNIVIAEVAHEFDQAIASLEGRLGLAWTWRNVTVQSGYEMANWFGLSDRSFFSDDSQEATLAPVSTDVLLEGLYLQVALDW